MSALNTRKMPLKEENTASLYLRPVPNEIKKYFKAECARNGISMLQAQLEFMRKSREMLPLLRVRKSRGPKMRNRIVSELPTK